MLLENQISGKTRKQTREDCWDQLCWHPGRTLHIQLSLHSSMEKQGSWGATLTILLWPSSFASSPFSPLGYVCEFDVGVLVFSKSVIS